MKLIIVCLILLGVFAFLVGPTILSQKQCYDTAQTNIADINSKTVMRGTGIRQSCESKFAVLTDLEFCVHNPNTVDKFTVYKETLASFLIPYIRPLTNTVEAQKTQHDVDCSEFKTLMFSSPL